MKINSLVVCINDIGFPIQQYPQFNWVEKNQIYTVRKYQEFDDGRHAILVEEIINDASIFSTIKSVSAYYEPHFLCTRFRLLQEPITAEQLLKQPILQYEY